MEDSRNIIKAIDALTLKAGGEVVDSKNITEAIDRLKAVYDESAIGIDKTLTHEGLAADAKAVGDVVNDYKVINITNETVTLPEGVSVYGDSRLIKCGRICCLQVYFKINNAFDGVLILENIVNDNDDMPLFNTTVIAGDGTHDGLTQLLTIRTDGSLAIWPSRTGLAYCQGCIVYIAKGL